MIKEDERGEEEEEKEEEEEEGPRKSSHTFMVLRENAKH